MANIKGFIFDMDGVITETSVNHYLAWKQLASEIDIEIDESVNEHLKGISRIASLDVILKHGGKENEFTDEDKFRMTELKNKHYVDSIRTFTSNNLLEGIKELFIILHEKNIKIAIASASKSAPMLVKLLGISEYVDYIVDPSSVPGKPAPDIFLKAAKALNLNILDCVGIEDAKAGVEAINSAGIFSVGIGSKVQLGKANLIFEETKHIDFELIERCFNERRQES